MKYFTLLILFTSCFLLLAQDAVAKQKIILDADTSSVQLLKQMTADAEVKRSRDIPTVKADISADIQRAAKLHEEYETQKYNETCGYYQIGGKDINLDKYTKYIPK